MIKKILTGYGKAFRSIGFVFLLIICCALLSAAVVYPLWLLAEKNPAAYTVTAFALIGACLVFSITTHIIRYLSRDSSTPEVRQERLHKMLTKTVSITGFMVAFVLFVLSVMNAQRLLGFGILIAAFVIYGIFAFGIVKKGSK